MNGSNFDQLARTVSPARDRRTSLKALGAATLSAALASPLTAEARKRGKNCGKKRKKQCETLLLPCCATCNANSTFACLRKFLFIVA